MKKTTLKKTVEQLRKQDEAAELRKQLTIGPDLLIEKKSTDEALDRRLEKIELINGESIDLKKLRDYIDGKIAKYSKRFGQEFYHQIFRLNGWVIPASGVISHKPGVVGQITVEIIYGRFPKEVLPELQQYNKYDEIGMRMYKHFQLLSDDAVKKLDVFILDSVSLMKECKHWDQFVRKHAEKYGHPFQASLFD